MAVTSDEARRKLLQERLEAKRQVEKKSLQSLEALLGRNITELELLDHCDNLWQQSYQDCTEERALGELCGYPLCDNPVAPQSKKLPTYRISLRTKKVYLNEKQRLFCGVRCHERSESLKSQLSEVPLWMSEAPRRKRISLDLSNGDSCGHNRFDGNVLPQSKRISANEIELTPQEVEELSIRGGTEETVRNSKVSTSHERTPQLWPPEPYESESSQIFTVDKIERLFCEWFTITTLYHIVGKDRFLELRAQYDQGLSGPPRSVEDMMAKFSRLCSFLDQQEKLDGITYSDEDEEKTEDIPQVKEVGSRKTSTKQMKKKKVSFKSYLSSEAQEDSTKSAGTPDDSERVLPPVHKHHQEMLRQKILLERLSPLVETTAALMRSPAHLLAKDVSQLIQTFFLTRENCLIRDDETAVVFVAILMLLDRKAGGEGQVPQDVRDALDPAVKKADLAWGDITLVLRKATDPQRLFNPRETS